IKAQLPVTEENWELVTLNQANLEFAFNNDETAKEYAATIQSTMSAAIWVQMSDASDEFDVTELLGAVKAGRRRGSSTPPFAPSSVSLAAMRSKASCWGTASSPSSRAHVRRSRRQLPAPRQ